VEASSGTARKALGVFRRREIEETFLSAAIVCKGMRALVLSAAAATMSISASSPEAANPFSASGGTLVVAIPTSEGLVIAADRRTTPRGVYCDGVR
jgi:hypothetical protein